MKEDESIRLEEERLPEWRLKRGEGTGWENIWEKDLQAKFSKCKGPEAWLQDGRGPLGRSQMGEGGDGGEEGSRPDCARSVSSVRNSTFILNEVKGN